MMEGISCSEISEAILSLHYFHGLEYNVDGLHSIELLIIEL